MRTGATLMALIVLAAPPPLAAQESDVGVAQIPVAPSAVRVEQPPVAVGDPLSVDQPAADAVDRCTGRPADAPDACDDAVLLTARDGDDASDASVRVLEDGVYLRLTTDDEIEDPYDGATIARQLTGEGGPAPTDFGAGAVALELATPDPVAPPPLPLPDALPSEALPFDDGSGLAPGLPPDRP